MVYQKIREARNLSARFGEVILRDKGCATLLNDYRLAIETTWTTMEQVNVVKGCIACSEKEAGGCCFKGVENWYDHILLLINLLLGAGLPESRENHDGCLFVGPTGCKLIARHSFCINYLCKPLLHHLDPSERKRLMAMAGKEIYCGIQVEEAIRKWLSVMSNPPGGPKNGEQNRGQ